MTERLYYADSFLMDFDAVVTEIQELSRVDGRSLWRVALDRSAFYPTGGGQPHDTGQLIATARSGAELTAEIIGVEEDEHDEVWHHTEKPLLPGTAVRGVIDAARRLDHIQQHSGQHLLSASFVRVCGAATVSFHLGEMVSTIDLATDTLSETTLQEVAMLANRIIAEDRLVTVSTVSRTQAEAWLAAGEMCKLPPREGEMRIVKIPDEAAAFDRNACGGTHVRSTGQIGGLHLRGTEKVRGGWRVEFVCGLRAMQAAHNDFQTLTEAGRNLSVGLTEVPEAVQRMQAETKRNAKTIQAQLMELAGFRAAELVRETPIEEGVRWVKLTIAADGDSAGYAKLLARTVTALAEKTMVIFFWSPAEENKPATILVARSSDLELDCDAMMRQTLSEYNGRGGGSSEMSQGSLPQKHLSSAVDRFESIAKKQVCR